MLTTYFTLVKCPPMKETFTVFMGTCELAHGELEEVTKVAQAQMKEDAEASILAFADATGKLAELPLTAHPLLNAVAQSPRKAGRPRLGVQGKEVTLLPRHWDWLAAQSGGASTALRKLVESALRADKSGNSLRHRQDATFHFMTAMAGNFSGYEEAIRALYATNEDSFLLAMKDWAADVRKYAHQLAFPN